MMALVRGVIARSTMAGSMFKVSASTSTRTGRAPTCSMTLTEAANVNGVVITSSPGPTPSVTSAVCRAAVHEFSASAPDAPRYAAILVSNRFFRTGCDTPRTKRRYDFVDLLLSDQGRCKGQEFLPGIGPRTRRRGHAVPPSQVACRYGVG